MDSEIDPHHLSAVGAELIQSPSQVTDLRRRRRRSHFRRVTRKSALGCRLHCSPLGWWSGPTRPEDPGDDSGCRCGRFGRRPGCAGVRDERSVTSAMWVAGDRGGAPCPSMGYRDGGNRPATPAVLIENVRAAVQEHVDDSSRHEQISRTVGSQDKWHC